VSAQSLFDADVDTVRIIASGQRFTPRQSVTPGGGPRHTADYDVNVTWEPSTWRAREEWVMHTVYPADTVLEFTMTYAETAGIKEGRDNYAATGPSTVPIGAARIGVNFKDLWLTNPTILGAHAEASIPATPISVDGRPMQRMTLWAHDTEWTMIVDPGTGLPAEVITTEADPHNAQAPIRVLFSGWREVSGVPFPFQVEQYVNGKLLRREIRSSIEVNPRDADIDVPNDLEATDEAMRTWGWDRSTLLLARAGLGGPQDDPQISNVTLEEVGPDIYHVAGGTHHALAIIGPDGIAMVDAPWFPERSAVILGQLQARWPELPVRYIILTHHHIDHSGGFRSFIEAGATLVAHADTVPFFEEALRLAGHPNTRAVSVSDSASLEGIGRRIEVFDIANAHADGYVATYVPDARLMFNADLFSPNRSRQFPPWLNGFLNSLRYHGIEVERHVGGHGSGYGPAPE
jgi:glyoxylase-like metal-dependent hydrolase (beta-lactamase superfamily II)